MSGESGNLNAATAAAPLPSAPAPGARGEVADVRVTVIPAHSPVGETAQAGENGPRSRAHRYLEIAWQILRDPIARAAYDATLA